MRGPDCDSPASLLVEVIPVMGLVCDCEHGRRTAHNLHIVCWHRLDSRQSRAHTALVNLTFWLTEFVSCWWHRLQSMAVRWLLSPEISLSEADEYVGESCKTRSVWLFGSNAGRLNGCGPCLSQCYCVYVMRALSRWAGGARQHDDDRLYRNALRPRPIT